MTLGSIFGALGQFSCYAKQPQQQRSLVQNLTLIWHNYCPSMHTFFNHFFPYSGLDVYARFWNSRKTHRALFFIWTSYVAKAEWGTINWTIVFIPQNQTLHQFFVFRLNLSQLLVTLFWTKVFANLVTNFFYLYLFCFSLYFHQWRLFA